MEPEVLPHGLFIDGNSTFPFMGTTPQKWNWGPSSSPFERGDFLSFGPLLDGDPRIKKPSD